MYLYIESYAQRLHFALNSEAGAVTWSEEGLGNFDTVSIEFEQHRMHNCLGSSKMSRRHNISKQTGQYFVFNGK